MTKIRTEKKQKAELLVSCLRKHQETAHELGISDEQLNELESLAIELGKRDLELEDIRAKVSTMSKATLEKEMALSHLLSEIKKVIKSHFDPTLWLTYGVQDKR
ncbi:MAG: hypothetical protein ACI308_07400 [Muribaculaceae bacterium]